MEGKIVSAHGSGGKYTHDLIRNLFVKHFSNEKLNTLADSAILGNYIENIVFTTDSHVVRPLFFPGGDIGKLAVTGTVNDLAVCGAKPLFLSCAMIIEEGFSLTELEKIVISMRQTAEQTDVQIVTGDTKVVEYGNADSIYINTSGVGILHEKANLGTERIKTGDVVIVSGFIGDHEAAIIKARQLFDMKIEIESDCAPVNCLTESLIQQIPSLKIMRDPTRGGLATTLNEFVWKRKFGIRIFEEKVPVREAVRGLCEPLGFDPLYMANEGKIVIIVGKEDAEKALNLMQSHDLGRHAAIIGEVIGQHEGMVLLKTSVGADRILDMLSGEQLPRIC